MWWLMVATFVVAGGGWVYGGDYGGWVFTCNTKHWKYFFGKFSKTQTNNWKYVPFHKIFSTENILHSENILHIGKHNLNRKMTFCFFPLKPCNPNPIPTIRTILRRSILQFINVHVRLFVGSASHSKFDM